MSAIAKEIASQIGNKAFFMMGVKKLIADKNTLMFDIKGSPKWRRIKITLNSMDLYDVTFLYWRGTGKIKEQAHENMYNDMLHELISRETGLALSL